LRQNEAMSVRYALAMEMLASGGSRLHSTIHRVSAGWLIADRAVGDRFAAPALTLRSRVQS
jgi:hypothetical protein